MAKCIYCGDDIDFRKLKSGKWITVQAKDTEFVQDDDGPLEFIYKSGEVATGRAAETDDQRRWSGREPHRPYCGIPRSKRRRGQTAPIPKQAEPEPEKPDPYEQICFLGG